MSAELQAALRQRTTVASSRDAAIDAIVSALDIYGENVAALACDFFDETMEITGYSGLSAQMPSGIFSREEIERIAHYQATKLTDGNSEGFVEQVSTDAANLVYQTNIRTMLFQAGMGVNGNDVSLPSNDQTAYVAHASPHADYEVRYQRIPQGIETCDFCLMLASRGLFTSLRRRRKDTASTTPATSIGAATASLWPSRATARAVSLSPT